MERNAELSALYPGAVANIVHVELNDGRKLTKRVDYPLGHAKNPLKDAEVENKFLSLAAPALGEGGCKRVVDFSWKLDEAKGIGELMKLVKVPA